MEDVEVVVRCIPTSVVFECPYLEKKKKKKFFKILGFLGTPQNGGYEILECQKCGKKFEIQGQEWS